MYDTFKISSYYPLKKIISILPALEVEPKSARLIGLFFDAF
jgi:hypothetical protein